MAFAASSFGTSRAFAQRAGVAPSLTVRMWRMRLRLRRARHSPSSDCSHPKTLSSPSNARHNATPQGRGATGAVMMKKGIHPKWFPEAKVRRERD